MVTAKNLMIGAFLLMQSMLMGQNILSEYFDSGNSIPTSSSNAPAVPTDYQTSSGVWTLFKTYGHGTTNYSAPYALRLLKNTAQAPAYASTPALSSAGTISFYAYGSSAKPLYIYKSVNNGTDWIFIDSVSTGSGVFAYCAVQVNDGTPGIRLRIVNGTGAGNDLNLDNVEITGYSSSSTITLSSASLPSFGAIVSGGLSGSASYTVSGYNLTSDITVSAPQDYQVSLNDTLFSGQVILAQDSGTVPVTTIFARYAPSSASGSNSGSISHSSSGAATQQSYVTGTAIAAEPASASAIGFFATAGNSTYIQITGGDGMKRLVVARKSASVNWTPADGVIYTGESADFTSAADLGGGNRLLLNGSMRDTVITGLEGGTTYHFAVFEYMEGTNNSQNYLTAGAGTGSVTTDPTPLLSITPAQLQFGNVMVGTLSQPKTITVSGSTLSPLSGNILVSASSGYTVSLTSGSGYSSSLQIPYNSGVFAGTVVYVRFEPQSGGAFGGYVTFSGGSAPQVQTAVTGTGITQSQANVFEAEDAIFESAYIRRQYSGYSGWGYADLADRTGSWLEFLLRKPNATSETLTIHYANGGSTRSYSVSHNGSVLGSISFPSTGSWTSWSTVTYQISLVQGVNRIRFASTTNNTNANIDKLELTGETAIPLYRLTLLKSGEGTVSADQSGELFDKGTVLTLTATPAAGNSFYRWNGTEVYYGNPFQVTMNGHKTQIALMTDTTGFAAFPYYPAPKGFAAVPGYGYTNGTTGGASEENHVVYVSNTSDLQNILLRRQDANGTMGLPPLTIYLSGILARDAGIGEMVDVKDSYDISIIGTGRDATITGYGLNIVRSKNIIVRNIRFASWGDDGISVDGGDDPAKGNHIWIDHCTFTYTPPPGYPAGSSPDGSLDITHAADYVTVSYCLFDSTDKNSLVGHSNSNVVDTVMKITYHHNWFKGSNQRNPRVRFGKVHVLNNYYTNNGIYAVSSNMEADVLVEGNYFYNTPIPTETSRDGGPPGDLVERYNIFENCGPAGTRGTAFEASAYYSYTIDPAAIIPEKTAWLAGSGKYDFSNPEHIVPAELTTFTARVIGGEVELEWKTGSEMNNAGWSIERRSVNGAWQTAGYVQGAGTSAESNIYRFRDSRQLSPGTYFYRLAQHDFDGTTVHSGEVSVELNGSLSFRLHENYPNPFNPTTKIRFELPQAGLTEMIVYDILGNKVREIFKGNFEAGLHETIIDASGLSSGLYIYVLQAGSHRASGKMILLK
ncbi:MAG: carbohydrate-binding protein [Ignavibacteriales bacterium]|nr:MAG: carbohydrate-binding protein [Ignavibacteriales bacterium]